MIIEELFIALEKGGRASNVDQRRGTLKAVENEQLPLFDGFPNDCFNLSHIRSGVVFFDRTLDQ